MASKTLEELLIHVGGDHHDRAGIPGHDPARRFHAVHLRHDQVHEDEVGRVLGATLDGFRAVARDPGQFMPARMSNTRRIASTAIDHIVDDSRFSCVRLADQIHHRLQQGFVMEAAFGQIIIRAGLQSAQPILLAVFVGNNHDRQRF